MKNLVMQKKRGRKPKVKETVTFDPKTIQIFKGSELSFNEYDHLRRTRFR